MNDPSITDWMSAIAAVVASITTVVTAYLAYKQYLKPPEEDGEPNEAVDASATIDASEMLVFKTSKQETWLYVDGKGLHCKIEDSRPSKGGYQWTLTKNEVSQILKNKDLSIDPGYKARTGLFTIGRKRNWLYSKHLFPEPHFLRAALISLLERIPAQT
ncbi:hypothetical protein [Amylibacter sp. IMCC11727]|uniref:hypothetical protein n=1 Tax=Amylibacter sp. IMCC11727 TaxID=3039851 RepID=UPI00244E18D1|nr:hypothetical protein [Amylibacter sp. IMCC11727]WGI21571.1 hypothetical protein QBD29_15870 [Amylibacter sp. IMCC11727]